MSHPVSTHDRENEYPEDDICLVNTLDRAIQLYPSVFRFKISPAQKKEAENLKQNNADIIIGDKEDY